MNNWFNPLRPKGKSWLDLMAELKTPALPRPGGSDEMPAFVLSLKPDVHIEWTDYDRAWLRSIDIKAD